MYSLGQNLEDSYKYDKQFLAIHLFHLYKGLQIKSGCKMFEVDLTARRHIDVIFGRKLICGYFKARITNLVVGIYETISVARL